MIDLYTEDDVIKACRNLIEEGQSEEWDESYTSWIKDYLKTLKVKEDK